MRVSALTEHSSQILQQDREARKNNVVEEDIEVDEKAAKIHCVNNITDETMPWWNNMSDESNYDDQDYAWDHIEQEVDAEDDNNDTSRDTILWDSYKNVINVGGFAFT